MRLTSCPCSCCLKNLGICTTFHTFSSLNSHSHYVKKHSTSPSQLNFSVWSDQNSCQNQQPKSALASRQSRCMTGGWVAPTCLSFICPKGGLTASIMCHIAGNQQSTEYSCLRWPKFLQKSATKKCFGFKAIRMHCLGPSTPTCLSFICPKGDMTASIIYHNSVKASNTLCSVI